MNSHSEVSLRAGGHATLHVVLRTVNHGSGHAWTRCRDERRVRAANVRPCGLHCRAHTHTRACGMLVRMRPAPPRPPTLAPTSDCH